MKNYTEINIKKRNMNFIMKRRYADRELIANESPRLILFSPPVVVASKYKSESDLTPLEFPELYELDLKISEFSPPYQYIEVEGSVNTVEEFMLTEVIEFDARRWFYSNVEY